MAIVMLTDESAKKFLEEVGIHASQPRKYLWRRFFEGRLPANQDGRSYFFDPEKVKRALAGEGSDVAA